MANAISLEQEMLFSVGAVEEQLEKIYHDPQFTESKILKRFLAFIIQETIDGRAHCLKEYTIALNVLDKPSTFNPQENGIVRIHAGRLRRALGKYYGGIGNHDPLIISIPKGKYVPVFTNRPTGISTMLHDEGAGGAIIPSEFSSLSSLAVLPFFSSADENTIRSFNEGLCMQMGSALTKTGRISVISYQAVKNLVVAHPDYREMGITVGFSHVITGGTQQIKDFVRVNIQLVECATYRQVWSEVYEHRLTKSNLFEVQDEICQMIVKKMEEWRTKKSKLTQDLLAHSFI